MKVKRFIVSIICTSLLFLQHPAHGQYFHIKDVSYQTDYHFPLIESNSLAANRINDYLWGGQLSVLPGLYKGKPYDYALLPEGNSIQGTDFIAYQVIRNDAKIFSVKIRSEYTGAGINNYEHIYNFNPQTGNPLIFMDFFTDSGYLEIREKIINNRKHRLQVYLKTLDTTANGNIEPETYKIYKNCLEAMDDEDPNGDDMIVEKDSLILTMASCGYTHYFQATDAAKVYENRLPVRSLLPYMNAYGRCFFTESDTKCPANENQQMVFKGTIDNRYPITLVIYSYYENTCDAAYFYDKEGKAISLFGVVDEDGSIKFHTDGDQNKEYMALKKTSEGGFKGSWSKGKRTYPVALK